MTIEYDFPIINIRHATLNDIDTCQQMTRQHPKSFPFVTKSSLTQNMERGSLYIAEIDGDMVGFVSFRACRDGWQTVYELCVDSAYQGAGVGRALLYAVPTPIRLKCPTDLEASNRFYANAGMMLVDENTADEEALKWFHEHMKAMTPEKRPLTLWSMRVLTIHCQGNNARVPEWARKSGTGYGTRHDNKAKAWPFMLDIDFDQYYKKGKKPKKGKPDTRRDTTEDEKRVVWTTYLARAATLRPVLVLAPDYISPDRKAIMLEQVQTLRDMGFMRIAVCPKFDGAVADIPSDCIIAVSVPSSYAGFVPQHSELVGRRVHLLGGSPNDITSLIVQLGGAVISADYNVHERNAQDGMIFNYGRWVKASPHARKTEHYTEHVPFSGANIRRHLNAAAEVKQERLL